MFEINYDNECLLTALTCFWATISCTKTIWLEKEVESIISFIGEVISKIRASGFIRFQALENNIEITSWKARAFGIFTRVGEVSEIERVSAANEWDLLYKTNECENPVQTAFHAVIYLFYTYRDFFNLSSFNWFSNSLQNSCIKFSSEN